MKSPMYPKVEMSPVMLEDGLKAWRCPGSGGHWISGDDYRDWIGHHADLPEKTPETPIEIHETPETAHARLCPETGRLLTRYKVGHGLSFTIDFSAATGGVWLDKDEWEALKSRNLHDDIHLIFQASWQKQRREEEQREALTAEFQRRLGGEVFEKAHAFKEWMSAQPQRRDILTYLQDSQL